MTAPTERTGATDSEVEQWVQQVRQAWGQEAQRSGDDGDWRKLSSGILLNIAAAVPRGEAQRTAEERLAEALALHVSDGDSGRECRGCRAECLYCEADHSWPCPTARAAGAS